MYILFHIYRDIQQHLFFNPSKLAGTVEYADCISAQK